MFPSFLGFPSFLVLKSFPSFLAFVFLILNCFFVFDCFLPALTIACLLDYSFGFALDITALLVFDPACLSSILITLHLDPQLRCHMNPHYIHNQPHKLPQPKIQSATDGLFYFSIICYSHMNTTIQKNNFIAILRSIIY